MPGRSLVQPLLFVSLLIVLAVAPWLPTPLCPESRNVLEFLLVINALVFVIIAVIQGLRGLPWAAFICWTLLILQGWMMVLNAGGTYELRPRDQPHIEAIARTISWLPSALDTETSRHAMIQVTGLAAIFGSACIVGQSLRWRRRTLAAMLLIIVCIAVEGFLERAKILGFYADQPLRNEGIPFASFNYHANAGAFLNLGLALACGGAVTARNHHWRRWLFVVTAAVCLAGVAATGSRGSAVISAGILAASIAAKLSLHRRRSRFSKPADARVSRRLKSPRPRVPTVAVITASILLVALLSGAVYEFAGSALARWSTLPVHLNTANPRLILWRLMLPEALDAGPFGFGSGQFKILLSGMHDQLSPLYAHWIVQPYNPAHGTSMWLQMHNDPLQTIVEWGWIGIIVWGVLFIGALWPSRRPDRAQFAIRLAIAACLVHACFDFPLQVPAIQTYIAALLGLAWARPRPRFEPAVQVHARRHRLVQVHTLNL